MDNSFGIMLHPNEARKTGCESSALVLVETVYGVFELILEREVPLKQDKILYFVRLESRATMGGPYPRS